MPSIHKLLVGLLSALILLSAGCQNRAASKLSGRWDLLPPEKIGDASEAEKTDLDEVAAQERAAGNTDDLYNSLAEGETMGTMALVFHRNGKLETFTDFPMASLGRPKTGTWSVEAWDAKSSTVTIKSLLEPDHDPVITKIRFIDDDTIQLIPPNIAVLEMELRFGRK